MSPGGLDRSDPRPMLAIFALAGAYGVWRLISSFRLDDLLAWLVSIAPLALGALAIASALATHRFLATRRTLRSRRAFAVVPAEEFDAEPEAVLRFAAQLASGDRGLGGWTDRRASAVRVRLTNDREGRLVYLLEVPERSEEALRTALRSYRGIELRPASEVLGEGAPDRDGASEGEEEREEEEGPVREPEETKRAVLRTELRLARPSVEPLARLGLVPDPLQPFAAAIVGLQAGVETSSVCIDLLPASGLREARRRRLLRRQARRAHRKGKGQGLAALLRGEEQRSGRLDPEEQLARREAVEALERKLGDGGELFQAQVLLRTSAPTKGRAKVAMAALLAAFRPLAEKNRLRAAGLAIPGLGFGGADLPLLRRRFERRFASGVFRPARRSILTARELAGFLKPPSVNCDAPNVLRSGALLAAPPELPIFDPGRADLIPLGHIATEGGDRLVGVPVADTFFTYVAGRSRYGKTETAIAQFTHLVRSGHGGLFLDPHGDALERIEPYLADEDPERIVRIDLGPGSRPAELPAWNLFELGSGEASVEAVVDAFASALEWGERSTRAINLTTQAATALVAVAERLDPQLAPTIFQLPTLLGDAEWREPIVALLPSGARRFWRERFPLLAPEAITPITNLIDRLYAAEGTRALLGQSTSSYRVAEAMDEGKVVLACPGSGGTRERLVANLLLFDLLHAARARASKRPEKRKPFWVFLDEVQSYDGAASGNLAALLEQSAKFGVRAVLMNQNPERLSPATLNALTTNRSHLLASALNSKAAALLTKEWGGEPSPAALTRLERYRFVAQVTHEGSLSKPFALGGMQLGEVAEKPKHGEEIREHDPREGGNGDEPSPDGVNAHLDGLEEQIAAALRDGGEGPAKPSTSQKKSAARVPRGSSR